MFNALELILNLCWVREGFFKFQMFLYVSQREKWDMMCQCFPEEVKFFGRIRKRVETSMSLEKLLKQTGERY